MVEQNLDAVRELSPTPTGDKRDPTIRHGQVVDSRYGVVIRLQPSARRVRPHQSVQAAVGKDRVLFWPRAYCQRVKLVLGLVSSQHTLAKSTKIAALAIVNPDGASILFVVEIGNEKFTLDVDCFDWVHQFPIAFRSEGKKFGTFGIEELHTGLVFRRDFPTSHEELVVAHSADVREPIRILGKLRDVSDEPTVRVERLDPRRVSEQTAVGNDENMAGNECHSGGTFQLSFSRSALSNLRHIFAVFVV